MCPYHGFSCAGLCSLQMQQMQSAQMQMHYNLAYYIAMYGSQQSQSSNVMVKSNKPNKLLLLLRK